MASYDSENEIVCNIEVLKFNLCCYNNAYILVRGNITVQVAPAIQVVFKIYASFTKFII